MSHTSELPPSLIFKISNMLTVAPDSLKSKGFILPILEVPCDTRSNEYYRKPKQTNKQALLGKDDRIWILSQNR